MDKLKFEEKNHFEKKKYILVNKKNNFKKQITSDNINHIGKKQKNESITRSKNTIKTFESLKYNKGQLRNMKINNYQFEIKEKNIIFKNKDEEKRQILGKILSEFNSNPNQRNNIFDNNNNNNSINTKNQDKNNSKKINRIQEIKINYFNQKNNNKTTNSSVNKNIKKLQDLKLNDINNNSTEYDLNNYTINNFNNSNDAINYNYLNTEFQIQSVKNRNRLKNMSLNHFTYNEIFNKSNTYKDFHKTPKNYDRINNNNNINNINNNISLNNRYNFFIKIGKTTRNEKRKDNNINYEIKLDSVSNRNKRDISSNIIKRIINNYEIDNLKENNTIQGELKIKAKPLFKKLEVQKVLNNNLIKDNRNKKNKLNSNIKIQRTANNISHSFNKKKFQFLVRVNGKRNLKTPFNIYFNSSVDKKRRSQSNQKNNNNSLNYSDLIKNTETQYERSESKNINNNKLNSLYNIGVLKKGIKFYGKKTLKKSNINSIDIIKYNKNINSKKGKIIYKYNEMNNKKNYSQTQRIIYNCNKNNNKANNLESSHHSKANSTLSTFSLNSNLNSFNNINSLYYNMNTNNRILSPTSSRSTNLSFSAINLETLYVLHEKLKLICDNLQKSKRCDKISFDYINYYFSHFCSNELINLIESPYNQNIIIRTIKIELLGLFLLYDTSFKEEIKEIEIILKTIFSLLYKNLLLTISFVITKYKNQNNNIILILNKIIKDNAQEADLYDTFKELDESKYINAIKNNYNKIIDYCSIIIENIYKRKIDKNNNIALKDIINSINHTLCNKNKLEIIISIFFAESYNKIDDYTIETLKNFFYSSLNYKNTFYKNEKTKKIYSNNSQINYLLPKIKEHKYTLVLDLDGTLVYSKINYQIDNNKIIKPKTKLIERPGLHEFLHDMKILYELIIFSSRSQDYVSPIIQKIENDEKFFDYVLYKQHMFTDENGDIVKNLNSIGRNLNSTIIIDDDNKNFKMQKENGICIRPFYGNNISDDKTLNILNKVLQRIRFDADETKDIRISLRKFKHLLYPIVISEKE